jgi:hypothetical protein
VTILYIFFFCRIGLSAIASMKLDKCFYWVNKSYLDITPKRLKNIRIK